MPFLYTLGLSIDLLLIVFPFYRQPYIEEIFTHLRGDIFRKFVESDKYTRFCQWKNLELNIQVSLFTARNDATLSPAPFLP